MIMKLSDNDYDTDITYSYILTWKLMCLINR